MNYFFWKTVNAQLINVQSLTFENSNETTIDALLLQIYLSFKFKIIKFEKIKIYKSQNENKHQRWFENAKMKRINISKYFIIDKVKIL